LIFSCCCRARIKQGKFKQKYDDVYTDIINCNTKILNGYCNWMVLLTLTDTEYFNLCNFKGFFELSKRDYNVSIKIRQIGYLCEKVCENMLTSNTYLHFFDTNPVRKARFFHVRRLSCCYQFSSCSCSFLKLKLLTSSLTSNPQNGHTSLKVFCMS
jgi:hypothetical protein